MPFKKTAQGEHHRRELVKLIREHHAAHGYAPSVRDLAGALALSPTTVLQHLNLLAIRGVVTWDRGVTRSLRLCDRALDAGATP